MASDLRLGVVAGLLGGVLFCVWALSAFLVSGRQIFDKNQTSLTTVLCTYLSAGGLGGLLVGAALPLARRMLGAALVGFLGAFVMWFLLGFSLSPNEPLLEIAKSSALLAAVFGLPLGVGLWYQVRRYKQTGKWS